MKQIINNQLNNKFYTRVKVLLLSSVVLLAYGIFSYGIGGLNEAQATVPKYINFQGKLTKVSDGTNMVNGNYAFEFKLYDALTSGSLLWTETFDQPSGACGKLAVTNGVFNAKLGSCNSLSGIDFTGGSVYLSVNFAPTGTSYDGEMSPRKQLVSSAFALVANGVSGDGVINTAVQSSTALTVGRTGSNPALTVDTNTASSATGLKVTAAAAGGGLAITTISSGTDENLTVDAKGAGTISIGGTSTGNILLAGGSGSTGCTITNSNGNLTCTGSITGASTGTFGYWDRTGTVLSPATAGDDLELDSGDYLGLSSSIVRLVFNDAARDNITVTAGDLLFSVDNTWDIGASGATRARTIYAGTSVIAPTINATTALQVGGADINTAGTLTNVAYLNQANTFTAGQTITPAVNTTGLAVSSYSLTGSDTHSLIDLSGTWNTSGTPTAIKLNITDTASGATSFFVDLQKAGSTVFSVNKNGSVSLNGTLSVGSTSIFAYGLRSRITSPADGQLLLQNAAQTDFGRLEFGGTTSSFPSIKRSGAGLQARLADDSGYTTFDASDYLLSGTSINTAGTLTNVAYKNQANTFTANNIFQPTVTTGTGSSAGVQISAGSLTSGNGLDISSSTLTSGNLVSISSNGTAAAASQTGLNISLQGTTATNAITSYGAQISNTHANATSGTNVALQLTASGATTANYALVTNGGSVGIGTTTPTSMLDVVTSSGSATESLFTVRSGSNIASSFSVRPYSSNFGSDIAFNRTFNGTDDLRSNNAYSSFRIAHNPTGSPESLIFQSATSGSGAISYTTALAISDTGRVGIGMVPAATYDKLQIQGSDGTGNGVALSIRNTDTSSLSFAMYKLNVGSGSDGGMFFGSSAALDAYGIANGMTLRAGTASQDLGFSVGNNVSGTGSGPNLIVKASGNVGIGDITPAALFTVGSGDLFQVNSSGAIAAATGITSSGTINFSGLTASSAIYTDGSKNLTSTAPTSGTIGYWSRSGTTLQPATANDVISISGNAGDIATIASSATGSANKALNVSQTGATVGTDYAGYFSNTGSATTNIGLYATATGATNNYAAIFDSGNVGIGTTGPDRKLDILDTSNPQMRLTYTDSSVYTDFQTDSAGILSITPTGNELRFTQAGTSAQIIRPYWGGNTAYGLGLYANASSISSFSNGYGIRLGNAHSIIPTTGTSTLVDIAGSFAPTSGNAALSYLAIDPTINQTGGASGISRGVYINPTLTSAADFRGLEVSNATGYSIYTGAAQSYFGGNVGIGDASPAALLTVGSGDLFQVNSSGAIAAVVGITNTGAQSTTVQSATALTVARTGTNYAFQVDTNTASSATGVKITSAAAAGGVAVAAISSGTDEALSIDAKGAGAINIGNNSTGSILFAGGVGSSGCTITTAGALSCSSTIGGSNLSGTNTGDQTITLTGDVTGSGTGSFATTIGSDKILESMLKAVDTASDEECLTYEATGGDFEWQSCGSALTPWTSNIDADGYALQDALNLEFRTAAGSAPAGTVIAVYADNSGDLTANVLTGKTFNIAVNGTDEYNFSSTALALNSNNITGVGTAITATAGLTVTGTAADLTLATATSGNVNLNSAGGTIELQDATNVTGALDVSTSLAVGTADAFQVASSGNVTSANAGTWTFSNDTNFALTGGVNGLSFDGTTFSVDATNNRIGIGTAAPTKSLDISLSGGSYEDNLRVINTNSSGIGAGMLFDHYVTGAGATASIARIYTASDGAAYGNQRLTLQSINSGGSLADTLTLKNGKVGINNTTPVDTLEVRGSWSTAGGLTLVNTAGSGNELNTILFYDSGYSSVSSAISHKLIAGATDTELEFFASTGSTMSQQMVIQGTGKVGIGTTAPDKPLEVNSATGAGIRITYNDGNGSAANYSDLSVSSGGDLTIAPSGSDTNITGNLIVSSLGGGGTKCLQTDNTGLISSAAAACGSSGVTIGDAISGGAANRVLFEDSSNELAESAGFTYNGTVLGLSNTTTPSSSGQDILTLASDYSAGTVGSGGKIQFTYLGSTATSAIRSYTFGAGATGLAFDTGWGANTTKMVINDSGNVGIGDTSPASLLTVGSGDLFQVNSSGAIAAAAGITSSGTITFSGISGSTQCLQANSSGVISGTGTACGSGGGTTVGGSITSGTANRVLYENASNQLAESADFTYDGTTLGVSNSSTTASNKVINISQTGATSGTDYAGYFSNTGAATTNVAGYFTASGGTNNYAAIFDAGNVGIGTTTPNAKLNVYGAGSGSFGGFAALANFNTIDESTWNAVFTNDAAGPTSFTANFVDDSGNFWIGNDNVSYILQVATTGGVSVGLGYGDAPLSAFDVNGGVAIGTYAGNDAAPTNGLIVSGKVGIGTAAPEAPLHVSGANNFGAVSFLGGTYDIGVQMDPTYSTDTAHSGSYASQSLLRMTNSSQASAATFGGQASAIYNTGSATLPANTNLFGSIGSVLMAGTGSVPAAAGVAGFVIRQNTNTIDSASGGVFGFQNYVGSGTTGTVTGVTIAQPISTAGHTITNTFGIYIADQTNTAGTQTNTPYAIYQAGSSNYNYFAGNVGVGDASPNSLFTVGSGDLFQINSSGQIGSQQAPVSDYLFALAGTTGNDNSRIIDITQANNATEDSNVINIVNTANPGTISTAITRSIQNITSSLTPTATVNGASASPVLNVYGSDTSVSLGSVTLADVTGANSADIAASSMRGTLTFDPIINDTGSTGISTLLGYGTYSSVTGAPTLTSVTGPTSAGTYGGYFSNTASSAGNANLTYSAIGIQASALGDLTTTGSTEHYGALILSTGTADTNYGIYADVSGATNNYAAILTGGNVGIGDTSPAALFTVGSGDLFQVNSSGAIAAATGITSSGTITFSGLGGSGTKCVQTDNAGVITAAASACGSGSGITIGTTAITSGSSGRILYDNAGVVGEMTTSGSGTVVALATTPTFTTNITTPIVNGSTSADGTLTIQGNNTTGNTSTSANLVFKVGDSAGTTAMTILNSGSVGIGTTGADRTLDILDASNPQIRLTTTDGSVYSDMQNSANINLAISGNTLSSSSARQYGLQINPTFNQSSTAGYTAFQVNSTETATGSAMNRLVDLQVGGSTKFAVRNDGSLTLQDTAYITTPYGGFGKFQNLLVRSEEFDNASWIKTSVSAPTADAQVAPDGSSTAESLATSGSGGDVCQWSATAAGSNTFTFSVWVKAASGTQNFGLRVDAGATSCATANNVTGTEQTYTATTSWQRYEVTKTFSSATGNVKVRIFPGTTGSTGTVYAWGAQLDQASKATNYAYTAGSTLSNINYGRTTESNVAATASSTFTYGARNIMKVATGSDIDATYVADFIRVYDNDCSPDCDNTTKGLEVQAYSGTNLAGTNIGIDAYGYTFGVRATTTGQASNVAQPAAVFADLDNGSATTTGNAIRAYTDNATSADLVSLYQETSTYTGNGLELNFGNGGGSFTGNFISLQKGGTESFHVDDDGSTFVSFTGTGTGNAVCHSTNGNTTNDELVDCSSTPSADFAEMYPVDSDIEVGDIVVTGTQMVDTYDATSRGLVDWNVVKGKIAKLEKSTKGYQENIVGVVSDNYHDFTSTGYNIKPQDNPKSIALKGRVLVKVTDENGPIKAGDYITASSTIPGFGAKATRSGQVVGRALGDFTFDSTDTGLVMVFMQVGYQSIGNTIVLDAPNLNGSELQSGEKDLTSQNTSTFVIQQQAAGEGDEEAVANILQLQTGDQNRFMVSSTGSTSILSSLNCELDADSCPSVLNVTQANTELMNIDARGTLTLAGTIIIKDDSFAGSIVTQQDGIAEIMFTYHLGTGKPVVQLTVEAQIPVFAQIVEFKQDEHGNYIGFVIKTFDLLASPVQAIVHYNVTGKQEGYITFGDAIIPSMMAGPGDSPGIIIENGQMIIDDNGPDDPITPEDLIVNPEPPLSGADSTSSDQPLGNS